MSTGKAPEGGDRSAENLSRLLHQFNQPLTAIGNYAQAGCQLIDRGIHDPARLREIFEKIALQSGRAVVLGQDLGKALAEGLPASR